MSFMRPARWPSIFPRLRKVYPDGRTHLTAFGSLAITANLFLCTHFFWTHFYEWSLPYGASMVPTIYATGDNLIISKLYRRGKHVKTGDIVCFKHPFRTDANGIKRVIGMPGDFVMVGSPDGINDDMIQVPQGHCFVSGDNQEFSRDSRMYGPIPLALITGKVIYRILPLARRGWIENGLKEPV